MHSSCGLLLVEPGGDRPRSAVVADSRCKPDRDVVGGKVTVGPEQLLSLFVPLTDDPRCIGPPVQQVLQSELDECLLFLDHDDLGEARAEPVDYAGDRKSTRLNSSH